MIGSQMMGSKPLITLKKAVSHQTFQSPGVYRKRYSLLSILQCAYVRVEEAKWPFSALKWHEPPKVRIVRCHFTQIRVLSQAEFWRFHIWFDPLVCWKIDIKERGGILMMMMSSLGIDDHNRQSVTPYCAGFAIPVISLIKTFAKTIHW